MKNRAINSILGMIIAGTLTNCGGDDKKSGPAPVEESPSPAPVAQVAEKRETPASPQAKDGPRSINLDGLQFVDTSVDLPGDFRIKKLERDSQGNFYAAVVSDVKSGNTGVAGYAVIKYDRTGKEVWRFPTVESAIATAPSANQIGSYMIGHLADLSVASNGDIQLIGIHSTNVSLTTSTGAANLDLAKWQQTVMPASAANNNAQRTDRFGNIIFVGKIRGKGMTGNTGP